MLDAVLLLVPVVSSFHIDLTNHSLLLPQNRDRLELYALHKQAISGDAPASYPADGGTAEKARYQAWKAKRGLTADEAMAAYIAECDRQVRVYGSV